MNKSNPYGSIPFEKVLYSNKRIKKLQKLINTQIETLEEKDSSIRREKMQSIEN